MQVIKQVAESSAPDDPNVERDTILAPECESYKARQFLDSEFMASDKIACTFGTMIHFVQVFA